MLVIRRYNMIYFSQARRVQLYVQVVSARSVHEAATAQKVSESDAAPVT